MSNSKTCIQCGSVLPDNGGPCPRCLMAAGLEVGKGKPLGPGFLDDLPMSGQELLIADNYRVLEIIGRGGMGVVYKAWQENLERVVAVKMVSAGAHAGAEEKQRFMREAKMAAKLQHPGIVAVYDWGDDEGTPFFSMEYIEGRDLAAEVKDRGPMDTKRAATLVKAVAEAVAYAHGEKVLHRDLKPQNLLLTPQESVKITDFGLAKPMDMAVSLTGTGQVLGTAGYMAPEQASGGKASPAVDVYGLGAVLYHLLTGRAPFVGNALGTVLEQVQHEEPLPVRRLNGGVPSDLDTICLKCLEKDADRRYESAADLALDLQRFLSGEPILARPATRWDRCVKWFRREPVLAWAIVTVFFSITFGLGLTLWQWRRAESSHQTAAQSLYAADVALAGQELDRNNAGRASELLAPHGSSRQSVDNRGFEWFYLTEQVRGDVLKTFKPHNDWVERVAISPDGNFVASASLDKTLKISDIRTLNCVSSFTNEEPMTSVAYSSDGRNLISGDLAGKIELWSVNQKGVIKSIRKVATGGGRSHVEFCLSNSAVVVGYGGSQWGQDGNILIGRLQDGQVIQRIPGTGGAFAVSSDGRLLATSDGVTLQTYSLEPFSRLWSVLVDQPSDIAWSHDNRFIIVGSQRGRLYKFDGATGASLARAQVGDGTFYAVGVYPDNGILIGGSETGLFLLSSARLQSMNQKHGRLAAFRCLSISEDGRFFVTGNQDGQIQAWDLSSKSDKRSILDVVADQAGAKPSISSSGELIAAADNGGSIQIHSVGTTQPITHIPAKVSQVEFLPGSTNLITLDSGGIMRRWEWMNQRLTNFFFADTGAFRFCISPDGLLAATLSLGDNAMISIWNRVAAKKLQSWIADTRTGYIEAQYIRFSPDSRYIAAAGVIPRVWDVATGRSVLECTNNPGMCLTVAIHPGNRRFFTAGFDGRIREYDFAQKRMVNVLYGHTMGVISIDLSPDGKTLCSTSDDRTVRLWNVATGREVLKFSVDGIPRWCRFSSDGSKLCVAGESMPMLVLDAKVHQDAWMSNEEDTAKVMAEGDEFHLRQLAVCQPANRLAQARLAEILAKHRVNAIPARTQASALVRSVLSHPNNPTNVRQSISTAFCCSAERRKPRP